MKMKVHKPNQKISFLKKFFIFSKLFVFLFILITFSHHEIQAKKRKATVNDLLNRIDQKKQQKIKLKRRSRSISKKEIKKIKPPKKLKLHSRKGYEAKLETLINQSIKQLYKLSLKLKKSKGRGEIWLRLAQAYIEKAKIVELRIHEKFERNTVRYLNKELFSKPKLNLSESKRYNKKSIELYYLYLKDFPKSKKRTQALFFIGYNYFKMNQHKTGEKYFLKLMKNFPKNVFTQEAYLILGEHYFEHNQWKNASVMYRKAMQKKNSKAYFLSLYKLSWCHYKLGNHKIAFHHLHKIILHNRRISNKKLKGYLNYLADEAIKNLTIFYAGGSDYRKARSFFKTILKHSQIEKQLEKLAHIYKASNYTSAALYTFSDLIQENPLSPKAFDYQMQIIYIYLAKGKLKSVGNQFLFAIKKFGQESNWYEENKEKPHLVKKSLKTLAEEYRLFILENHKIIQDSKNFKYAQLVSYHYKNYILHFNDNSKIDEMRFFYAELLFELKKYKKAADQYQWIVSNNEKSQYYKKSYFNLILSLEKLLPSIQELTQNMKKKEAQFTSNREIKIFQKYAKKFLEAFPNNKDRLKIEYKMALLAYYEKDFQSAEKQLKNIIGTYPSSKQARFASQFLIDFYQLKGNPKKFKEISKFINSKVSNLPSNIKNQIKEIELIQSFKHIENMEKKGKGSLYIANQYKALIKKKLKSKDLLIALFNLAIHLEKAKRHLEATQYYTQFIQKTKREKNLSKDISNLIKPSIRSRAMLYQKIGLYKKSADDLTAFAKMYPTDRKASEFLLNAGIIYDGLNLYPKAIQNYELYYQKSSLKNQSKVLYLMGKMSEKHSKLKKALIYFDRLMKNKFSEPVEKTKVAFFLSDISEKIGRKNRSSFWNNKTISMYKTLSEQNQLKVSSFAAQAEFKNTHLIYSRFKNIKLSGSIQKQSLAIQKKINLLEPLKNSVKKVISYNDGYQMVAALTIQGHAFNHIVKAMLNSPIPKELNKEEIVLYKKEIEKATLPFKKLSKESYELAWNKAEERKVFGKWRKELSKEHQRNPSSKEENVENLENFIENPIQHIRYLKTEKSRPLKSKKEARTLIGKIKNKSPQSNVLHSLSKLLDKNPNHIFTLNLLGIHHALRNEDGLSKIIFERALKNAKKSVHKSTLYNNLSILYIKEKDLQTAMTIKEWQ